MFSANEAEFGRMQNARLVARESWCELAGVEDRAVEQRLSHREYRDLINSRIQSCGELILDDDIENWRIDCVSQAQPSLGAKLIVCFWNGG